MSINKVVVAGSGVLGSQIAFQSAYKGFDVTVYDINEEMINKAKKTMAGYGPVYKKDIKATDAKINSAMDNLSYSYDLSQAAKDADLVIEAVPEKLEIKGDFYQKLSEAAPKETIFASNSSTLVPSAIVSFTDRPARFLNLHFANHIWRNNTAEIMGTDQTDPAVYSEIVKFAKAIGMVPIEIKKEQPGYVLNSLLIPLLNASAALWAKGVADPQTIDKTWMIGTGAPMGPFGIFDVVGLRTAYNITETTAQQSGDETLKQVADKLKEVIDDGYLGRENGKGFYTYPDPDFVKEDFLK